MNETKKVVIDASVVLAVILNQPEKASIIAMTGGVALIAPGCIRWEIGNAFSAMLKQKRLSSAAITEGMGVLKKIPIQEVDSSLEEALELCKRHHIYAYDAYYLQLAKRNSTPLLTLDKKMLAIAKIENIETKIIQ
jgi:predicted nucleic acid-binding protein